MPYYDYICGKGHKHTLQHKMGHNSDGALCCKVDDSDEGDGVKSCFSPITRDYSDQPTPAHWKTSRSTP